MHIYKIPVVSWSLAEGQPGERLHFLLIVFATSVCESSLLHFPLGDLTEQSFKCLLFPWQLIEGLGTTSLCSSSRTLGPSLQY